MLISEQGTGTALSRACHKNVVKRDSAEETRIRQFYRDLILQGRIRLSLEAARGLVGPDCAYHLYMRIRPQRTGRRR